MVPARRLVDIVVDFKKISSDWRMWVLSGYSGQSFVDVVWFFPGIPGCSIWRKLNGGHQPRLYMTLL